jgi:hypothetical protein
MSVSSRGYGSYELILDNDIERFEIDLRRGTSSLHNIDRPLVTDLSAWFSEQIQNERISFDTIDSATLELDFNCKSVDTNLEKVAFFLKHGRCNLVTHGIQLEAESFGSAWYTRGSA